MALPAAMYPLLTLECWVRPFPGSGRWMGLITQYMYSSPAGFGLFVDPNGYLASFFGDGQTDTGLVSATQSPLTPTPTVPSWHHVAAVFDGTNHQVRLYVDGLRASEVPTAMSYVIPGSSPLCLGAYADSVNTVGFLDGDLAMAVIYASAPDQSDPNYFLNRYEQGLATPPQPPSGLSTVVEACWPLNEDTGQTVKDLALTRNGEIVNNGTWMIGGPSFDATAVQRIEPGYDPTADASRGAALRLSSADIYDVGWSPTYTYTVPADAPSGLYVGRFRDSAGKQYDVPFVVRRAAGKPPAPIAVLVATNTWHAYTTFGLPVSWFSDGYLVPDMYNNYLGMPTYKIGLAMPLPMACEPPGSYGHLVRAERPLHAWLDLNGYDYDAFSDLDLHCANVLTDYRAVFIVGHSEYWSREMYLHVQAYLDGGGQVICASGNTMFWRVSFDEPPAGVM